MGSLIKQPCRLFVVTFHFYFDFKARLKKAAGYFSSRNNSQVKNSFKGENLDKRTFNLVTENVGHLKHDAPYAEWIERYLLEFRQPFG